MNPPNPTPSAQPSVMALKAAERIYDMTILDGVVRPSADMARIIDQEYAAYTAAVEEARQAWNDEDVFVHDETPPDKAKRFVTAMNTLARLHAEQQGKPPAQQGGETP